MPVQVAEALEALASASAIQRQLDASRALTARAFSVRAATLGMLEAGRMRVESSRSLIARAKAAFPFDEASGASTPLAAGARPETPPARAVAADPRGCSFSGCAHPSRFQPFFAVDRGDVRAFVLPLRVCAEHRPEVEALLFSKPVRAWLRGKLQKLGQREPEMVRILFKVVG